MMKNWLIFVLFFPLLLNAQNDQELLISSIKNNSAFEAKNTDFGYQLIGVDARFGTKKENEFKVEESITFREFIGDTMFIEIVTPANCCASFECELQAKDEQTLNLLFEVKGEECLCLRGIYLRYKIVSKSRVDNIIELNGKELSYRKHDPNESRDVTEKYENGQIKSIKMYLGDELKRVSYFDETGKRTKMLMYNNGKVIEKKY